MSNNEEIGLCKYTWNDYVVIKCSAPELFRPGQIGVICGMSKIKFEEVAKKYHSEIGEWIYTVEFGDGSDIQVPEMYLEKCQDKNSDNRS